ncbi:MULTISPECIES: hypothetical protein [unclassified Bradyrhizobium]|uniref:hypothetical protein n=1 Tax=unclassified Bradyrhizobium TaxID=2631580 RepID=UPI00247905CB|nr:MULTISPECIES: hypothetical protein [unclassified Bradyrhizobium]WGS17577.1 hypothetical protein MTX22_23360 [Bradyrhizobium sp. ISRA463]WGS24360.1 hypothetical protein MTX19_21025 [Bradyrhizobium sp. ISRA464]
MQRLIGLVVVGLGIALAVPSGTSRAQQRLGPNSVPLTFGMTVDQASRALGAPLNYVRGRPGNELFVALPNVKGSIFANRSDGLYLQFGRGHLIAWKGDWGTIRP